MQLGSDGVLQGSERVQHSGGCALYSVFGEVGECAVMSDCVQKQKKIIKVQPPPLLGCIPYYTVSYVFNPK